MGAFQWVFPSSFGKVSTVCAFLSDNAQVFCLPLPGNVCIGQQQVLPCSMSLPLSPGDDFG